jgi:quinol monooxygenase YgiN
MNRENPNAPHPDETFWSLEVEILPGKLEAFRAVVREMITSAENEAGTIAYEWYFNAADTVCHTYERYRNSEAVVAHAAVFGTKFVDRFLETCRPTSLAVYGAPNAEARALLDSYNPTYFSKMKGSFR